MRRYSRRSSLRSPLSHLDTKDCGSQPFRQIRLRDSRCLTRSLQMFEEGVVSLGVDRFQGYAGKEILSGIPIPIRNYPKTGYSSRRDAMQSKTGRGEATMLGDFECFTCGITTAATTERPRCPHCHSSSGILRNRRPNPRIDDSEADKSPGKTVNPVDENSGAG